MITSDVAGDVGEPGILRSRAGTRKSPKMGYLGVPYVCESALAQYFEALLRRRRLTPIHVEGGKRKRKS